MRALILSDIHANLEALNAVLAAAAAHEYDQIWNLGDVVGYGGSPNQVVEIVRPLSTLVVRGNHDRVSCGLASALGFNPVARAAALWTQRELTSDNLGWLRDLAQGPVTPREALAAAANQAVGGIALSNPELRAHRLNVTCVHGSPLNEDQYIMSMRDAWAPLQQMTTDVTFFGHTHIQGGFTARGNQWQEIRPVYRTRNSAESYTLRMAPGTRHLINPGSVGQPRDFDWRAAFAIYDSNVGNSNVGDLDADPADAAVAEITYYRIPYDLTASQGRILMAGLPERLAERLREGR